MYVCVYVCVYVCMYVCMYYVYMYVCIYVCKHVVYHNHRRYKAQTKPRISKTPTVLVNTNCDDYKVVFETPSYPDDPMYKTYKNLY